MCNTHVYSTTIYDLLKIYVNDFYFAVLSLFNKLPLNFKSETILIIAAGLFSTFVSRQKYSPWPYIPVFIVTINLMVSSVRLVERK